jgi:choline dehydrogenase-like flavoprotein
MMFDAIVIGSGMSGGIAAKELCERGLKVLVIERGRKLEHGSSYTDWMQPWDLPNAGNIPEEELARDYQIQRQCYAVNSATKDLWVKDSQHPYETTENKPFSWIRGYHLGGRSIMWGRQTYRFSEMDFSANKRDGHGIDWPIRYADMAPWYDKVETFIGVSGANEGLPQLPDGKFLPVMAMTDTEKMFKEAVEKQFPGRKVIQGRCAHLTEPQPHHIELGRNPASTAPCASAAAASAPIIPACPPRFRRRKRPAISPSSPMPSPIRSSPIPRPARRPVCASSTRTPRKSASMRRGSFPLRLHHRHGAGAAQFAQRRQSARACQWFGSGRAQSDGPCLWPHRRGRDERARDLSSRASPQWHLHPALSQSGGRRHRLSSRLRLSGRGDASGLAPDGRCRARRGRGAEGPRAHPGPWAIRLSGFGEMLPDPNNRVTLHASKTDEWGIPQLTIDCAHGENDKELGRRMLEDAKAMLIAAGATITAESGKLHPPGLGIHEMGTARMGHDPKTSVLNGFNQAHEVPNLFITDGAAMTSSGCQNPSLTYMAMSARAAYHATEFMKAGTI